MTFRRDCPLYPRVWPALVRLSADGTLDTGFGSGGGIVDFRGGSGSFGTTALDSNGGILVARGHSGIVRFKSDGTPDRDFHAVGPAPFAILPQPDRSLIVAAAKEIGVKDLRSALTVGRLGPTGMSKGEIGAVEDFETGLALNEILQVGDSFLAAGRIGGTGAVLRFNPAVGADPDPSFAAGGGILRPGGEAAPWISVTAIAAAADGFLIAGQRKPDEAVVARYDSEGVPDPGFGVDGVIRLDPTPIRRTPAALFAGPGGRVTLVGQRQAACPNLRPNRAERPTVPCAIAFVQAVESGVSVAEPAADLPLPHRGNIGAVALNDGRLLVSTALHAGAASRFAVVRLEGDGSVDPAFGEQGLSEVAPCRGKTRVRRRMGCIGSAMLRLRLRGTGTRRPRGVLHLVGRNQLDPILAVTLLLPPEIRAQHARESAVRVVTVPPRRSSVRVGRDRILADPRGGARRLSIGLGAGVLRKMARVPVGRKLVFRVLTTFKDGSTQRSVVRLAP
jgi:uncharacterized delta-60 repeat protein